MDVNKVLGELREALERAYGQTVQRAQDEAVDDAYNAFEALDQWLSKGGFLPTDWARGGE